MSERTGYWIRLTRARFGWWADMTDHGDGDRIGLTGPSFWRMTRQGALRRAKRYADRHRAPQVEEFPADDIESFVIGR